MCHAMKTYLLSPETQYEWQQHDSICAWLKSPFHSKNDNYKGDDNSISVHTGGQYWQLFRLPL